MSARALTASLAIITTVAWGAWIYDSGLDRNLALIGWMPFPPESESEPDLRLLVPTGIYLGLILLAWCTRSRLAASMIPLVPLIGFVLFWIRYAGGMSHFE